MVQVDTLWRYSKENEILSLTIGFKDSKRAISKSDAIFYLKDVLSKYKKESIYAKFNPKSLIIYPYMYGWEAGYNAYFSVDAHEEGYLTNPETGYRKSFFEEIAGKTNEFLL